MQGDYYNKHEVAKLLNIRYFQLEGMMQKSEMRVLFEVVPVETIDSLGRKIGRLNQMMHKDNIPEAKEFVKTRRMFTLGKKVQNGWTESARDCYNIGCNCSLCDVFRIIGTDCRMRDKVRELLKREGKDDTQRNPPRNQPFTNKSQSI